MTKAKRPYNNKSAEVPESFRERLLNVPMVRLDYTVKDVPNKGQSLPKSVRVCDINHVRYVLFQDMKIGKRASFYNSFRGNEWFKRQCLHVYNPYLKRIVKLFPQRIFEERKDSVFDPKMMAHPEWEPEFKRLVEVTGIPDIPKPYQHRFESVAITEGERAYYEWKEMGKEYVATHGKKRPTVYKGKRGVAA